MGSDTSTSAPGWRIDNVSIENRVPVCLTSCAVVGLVATSSLQRMGDVTETVTVANTGSVTANNVMLTTAKLGSVNCTPVPQAMGAIAAGSSATAMVTCPGVSMGPSSLSVGGTYTGGSFSSAARVSVP